MSMSSAPASDAPIATAWLKKQPTGSGIVKGKAHVRFFELHSHRITYFAKEDRGRGVDKKGQFELVPETVRSAAECSGTHLPSRHLLVACASARVAQHSTPHPDTPEAHPRHGPLRVGVCRARPCPALSHYISASDLVPRCATPTHACHTHAGHATHPPAPHSDTRRRLGL